MEAVGTGNGPSRELFETQEGLKIAGANVWVSKKTHVLATGGWEESTLAMKALADFCGFWSTLLQEGRRKDSS